MRKLRFEHGNEGGTHKKGWRVSKREVAKLALAYGIVNRDPPSATDTHDPNVTNVTDSHNVTPSIMGQRADYASVHLMLACRVLKQ